MMKSPLLKVLILAVLVLAVSLVLAPACAYASRALKTDGSFGGIEIHSPVPAAAPVAANANNLTPDNEGEEGNTNTVGANGRSSSPVEIVLTEESYNLPSSAPALAPVTNNSNNNNDDVDTARSSQKDAHADSGSDSSTHYINAIIGSDDEGASGEADDTKTYRPVFMLHGIEGDHTVFKKMVSE